MSAGGAAAPLETKTARIAASCLLFQFIATLLQQITVEFAIVFGCLFRERRRLLRGVESTFAMRQAIS